MFVLDNDSLAIYGCLSIRDSFGEFGLVLDSDTLDLFVFFTHVGTLGAVELVIYTDSFAALWVNCSL